MNETVDLLIHARWLIPVAPARCVLENHAVAVAGGRITDLLPSELARTRYRADKVVELPTQALIPGLVNVHTHGAMTLMRGIADDLPLMRWLQEAIWPAESRHVSTEFVRDGTLLAAAEMLRSGITTCNDMYFYPDAAARSYEAAGMRAVIGIVVLDFPSPWASDADDYLRKGLAVRDQWRGHPLLSFSLAPHAPYTLSDDGFNRVRAIADEIDLPLHIHIHETAQEISDSLSRHGVRPLSRLARLGLLGENLLAVHAVHLNDEDIDELVRHACAVGHCPTSNMKLGSGIAPLGRLLEAGLRVGLGTDGAASNNRLDILQEMRHAALLAKVATLDASAVPAHQALHMATLGGARALGMGDRIGSIEVGKAADLCAIELGDVFAQPCFDPLSHLVYVAGRSAVTDVWVNGESRVHKGLTLLHIRDKELLSLASLWQTRLAN